MKIHSFVFEEKGFNRSRETAYSRIDCFNNECCFRKENLYIRSEQRIESKRSNVTEISINMRHYKRV
jgi:hypothetical protein